jgi:hypothetical protein
MWPSVEYGVTAMSAQGTEFDWDPFIGRALAYVTLHLAEMDTKPLLDKAEFLMGLGLPRREAAHVLGSTDESIRVGLAKRAAKTRSASKKERA